MTYNEFLEYIFQRYSGNVKLGLDRITSVLEDMGNPQNQLKGIHIAGTNGKGSTCATCEALAIAHKLYTGLNTSPHLIDYCERFRIDGQNVTFEEVLDVFHRYEHTFSEWDASFFEITTAIAFQLFYERKVETSIIEVGLGGRLDATNLFIPQVSAITTIGLDHVKTLGNSLEKIAFEKAGIIKDKIPLVLGRIDDKPLNVILKQAAEKQIEVFRIDKDYFVSDVSVSTSGLSFNYKFKDVYYSQIQTNLLGRHQAANIAVALTCFLVYCKIQGIRVEEQNIRTALKNINWKGRMQMLGTNPIVIIDGAHNLQGIKTFFSNLQELFPNKKMLFVISILADKDYKRMLKVLCPLAKRFYISKNESDRAAEIDAQVEVVKATGCEFKTAPSVTEVFTMAFKDAARDDIVVGAGSLYTVAEIIRAYKQNY